MEIARVGFALRTDWMRPHGIKSGRDRRNAWYYTGEGPPALGREVHSKMKRRVKVPSDVVDPFDPPSMYPLARRGLR